jgi:hypothetical protein
VQREGYFHDGAFHDFVMMSMLEDDWRARRIAPGSAGSAEPLAGE